MQVLIHWFIINVVLTDHSRYIMCSIAPRSVLKHSEGLSADLFCLALMGHITHNARSPHPVQSMSSFYLPENTQLVKCHYIYLKKKETEEEDIIQLP